MSCVVEYNIIMKLWLNVYNKGIMQSKLCLSQNKSYQMNENFWKNAFKMSSFILTLVLMFSISVFIEDAQ